MSGNSTQFGDLTRVILALQDVVKALYSSQQTLAGGISVNTLLPSSTVVGLPTSAPLGTQRYVIDGRNSGQGAGAGTGCVVVGNGTNWTAVWSGATVTA